LGAVSYTLHCSSFDRALSSYIDRVMNGFVSLLICRVLFHHERGETRSSVEISCVNFVSAFLAIPDFLW
jgi:hypothetical protein